MKKILLLMFCIIMLVGTVNAFEFDNIKNYNEETKTVDIRNSILGIPFLQLGKVAEIELKTPLIYHVPRGYQKVAEFEVNAFSDYTNAFKELELYDKKDGDKKFTRNFDYKYKTIENVNVDDYGFVSVGKYPNGTDILERQKVSSHREKKEVWNDLSDYNFNSGESLTIGIFTIVEKDDYIEWIPNFFGVRISEWSVWTENLNVHLLTYYTLNETSGSYNNSVDNNYEGIVGGGQQGVVGKIDLAYFTSGAGEFTNLTGLADNLTNSSYSVNAWVLANSSGSGQGFWIHGATGGKGFGVGINTNSTALYFHSGGKVLSSPAEIRNDSFIMVTGVYDGASKNLYINGVSVGNQTDTYTVQDSADYLLARFTTVEQERWEGVIDEVGVWNRSLSTTEVQDLYNEGTGITFTDVFGPLITLNAPDDSASLSASNVTFNTTVTAGASPISEVTLFLDGISNETNTSGLSADYIFEKPTISEGSHNWSIGAKDSANITSNSSVRTFTIDTEPPNITNLNITGSNASGVIDYHRLNTNLTLTWNVTDLNLNTCVVGYNGINVTVNCTSNTTQINTTTANNKSLNFFTNDTLGFDTTSIVTWNYKIFENNQTFTASTIEGTIETFSINYNVGVGSVTIANLSYNNTQNIGSILANGGGNFDASETLTAPLVDTDTNLTFFWNFTFSDGTTINSSSNNQTILQISVDNCSVNSNVIYNYTIVDEENQTLLSNTTLEVDLNILSLDRGSSIVNFSELFTNVNPVGICININLTADTKYSADSIVRYEASEHESEFFNIQNFTLQNSTIPQNITLFDLLSIDSTQFQITFKDSDFVVVENALVQINRNYISEGTFKTVEIPKTDSNGQTVAHLVEKEVIYNMIVTKNGVILGTFNNVIAFCEDVLTGSCFITLNALTTNEVIFNYDDDIGLASTFNYNETSRILSYTFVTIDGGVKNVTLNAVKLDQIGNNTVCDSSLVSSSGTLTCTVPASVGNETIITRILVNGNLALTNFISAGTEFDIGITGVFLALILTLSLALMLLESKAGVIIGVVMGLITSILLSLLKGGLLGIGTSTLWLVITALILLWKLNKDGQT